MKFSRSDILKIQPPTDSRSEIIARAPGVLDKTGLVYKPSGGGGVALLDGATLILDARSISGVSDGAGVETWPDSSGNGFDATQATAGSRPLYRASVASLNNKPAADFVQLSSHFMSLPTLDAVAGDWTVYMVMDQTSTSQMRAFDSQAGRLTLDPATPSAVGYFDGALRTAGTSATGAQCLTFSLEAAASGAIYRARSALGTGLGYVQRAIAGTYVTIGAATSGSGLFLDAKVALFAIYSGVHTADQRAAQWDAINAIWGVTP